MLEDPDGIPADDLRQSSFQVEVAGARFPARLSLRPMYDPDRVRITA